jgi:hypothetical protein
MYMSMTERDTTATEPEGYEQIPNRIDRTALPAGQDQRLERLQHRPSADLAVLLLRIVRRATGAGAPLQARRPQTPQRSPEVDRRISSKRTNMLAT